MCQFFFVIRNDLLVFYPFDAVPQFAALHKISFDRDYSAFYLRRCRGALVIVRGMGGSPELSFQYNVLVAQSAISR